MKSMKFWRMLKKRFKEKRGKKKMTNSIFEKDFMRLLWKNNLEELSRLLDENKTDKIYGEFLSTLACQSANLDAVKLLHEKGRKFTGDAMEVAIRTRNLDLVKFLYKHRPEICKNGDIDFACSVGCLDIVKFLLESFPYRWTNLTGNLVQASKNGHVEIARYIASKIYKN